MPNAYINPADFFSLYDRRAFKELSGDQGQPQGDPPNLQFILDVCASKLDSYLNGRIGLPLTQMPIFLTALVADMAAYRLFMRRPSIPKEIKEANDRAEAWLQNLLAGGVTIPDAVQTVPVLQDSASLTGKSEFSHVFQTPQSPTEPGGPGH